MANLNTVFCVVSWKVQMGITFFFFFQFIGTFTCQVYDALASFRDIQSCEVHKMERNKREGCLEGIFQQNTFSQKMMFQGNSHVSWKFFGLLLRTCTEREAVMLQKAVCLTFHYYSQFEMLLNNIIEITWVCF